MKTHEDARFLLIVLIILGIGLSFQCSTTSQVQSGMQTEEVADIDELLGLSEKEPGQTQESAQTEDPLNEDDVLKLLGVTEEAAPEATQTSDQQSKTPVEDEIRNLEQQQNALDTREANIQQDTRDQAELLANMNRPSTTTSTASSSNIVWNSSRFEDRYQEALQEYRGHQYRESVQKFEALLSIDQKHSLSDNCQYWIGEAYYGMGNYRQAIVAFEKVFSFAKSNKDADSQLKLGLCYMRLNNKEQARSEFQKLIDNYPASEYVSMAQRYISQIE